MLINDHLLSDDENHSFSNQTDDDIPKARKRLFQCLGILLIVIGVILGIFISLESLFGIAGISKNRFLGFFMQLITLFLIIVGFTFFGLKLGHFCAANQKKQFIISLIIFAVIYLITLILSLLMFYVHPKQMLEYTHIPSGYWNLSTGSTIAYYEYGEHSTQKHPFIFLHGGPGSLMYDKYYFVDNLVSMGYKVYQYDQLGCGKSSRLDNCKKYTLQRHIDDLEEIRKSINAEKFNFISFSFGGTLGSNYIAQYPNNVENAIFYSPGDIWNADTSYEKLTKDGSNDQMKILLHNFHYLMGQALSLVFNPMGLFILMDEKDLDNLFIQFHDGLNMMPGSGRFYNVPGAGYGFWANVMTGRNSQKCKSPYADLKSFTGKSLVVKTQYDYISFGATVKYRDEINNSKLITFDGIGHSVLPERVQEIWDNFELFIINGTTIQTPYTKDVSPWA